MTQQRWTEQQLWTEQGLPVIAPQRFAHIRDNWVTNQLVARGYWPARPGSWHSWTAQQVREKKEREIGFCLKKLSRMTLANKSQMQLFGAVLGLHPAQIWPDYHDEKGNERPRPLPRSLRMFHPGRKGYFAHLIALRYPTSRHAQAPVPPKRTSTNLPVVAPQSSYNARWRWLAERLAELRVWTVQNPNSWELMSFPDGLLARCEGKTWTEEFRAQVATVLELHPSQIWPEYYVAAPPAPQQRALTLPARSTPRPPAPILTAAEAPCYDTLPEMISYAFGGAS